MISYAIALVRLKHLALNLARIGVTIPTQSCPFPSKIGFPNPSGMSFFDGQPGGQP